MPRGTSSVRYDKICAANDCGNAFVSTRKDTKYCCRQCYSRTQDLFKSTKHRLRRQAYQKKWGEENWERRREYNLKRSFGITSEQYNSLLKQQNFSCFICERPETDFAKKLAVDHNHTTGEIYGLLCGQCNKDVIGKRRDPAFFDRAAEYLRVCRTGWIVPPPRPKRRKRR